MKILIASDIHGRLKRAQLLEKAIASFHPDRIILLGDLLYNGPRNGVPDDYDPMGVIKILNKKARITIGVRGNCDSKIDEDLLEFKLEDSRILSVNGFKVNVYHGDGGVHDVFDLGRGDIVMFGHTHIPFLKEEDGVIFLNPGSISFPKKGFEPSFAIFTPDQLEIRTFTGEILGHLDLH